MLPFSLKPWRRSLCRILRIPSGPPSDERLGSDWQVVLDAINQAQSMGQSPRLRELHRITPLSQHVVLRVVRQLEEKKLVEIDLCLSDRLDSRIALTRAAAG